METIAEFNDKKGFNVKLTKDKIFVSAIGQEETFALRSVNGVGLYDDIEKYNKELEKNNPKNKKIGAIVIIVCGALFTLVTLMEDANGGGMLEGIVFIVTGVILMNQKPKPPVMDSFFKLMLSGGSREFKFDKTDDNAVAVAEFINEVEATLTAYN